MTVTSDVARALAARLRDSHRRVAADWLERLRRLLAIPEGDIFPGESLLDHIPTLIVDIANFVEAPAEQAIAANTTVLEKAQELGALRFHQQATVHQLLREYRLLSEVLTEFIRREIQSGGALSGLAIVDVNARVQEAVFVLMQATIDAFVGRYSETVAGQTARLEGFNRMVSHELRQPLGVIRAAAEVLKTPSLADRERDRCLALVERSTRRMATLTTALLALSAAGSSPLQIQQIDLGHVAADVAAQLAEMSVQRRVDLRIAIPAVSIVADFARLELVLVNLVSNAIKYSDPAKPVRFVEITATEDVDSVTVSVKDNGLGIPAGERSRVFEGFFRAHAKRDSELGADGLGLGLAIVAECVRYLQATVDVVSEDGVGTEFRVCLPRTPQADTRSVSTNDQGAHGSALPS